MHKCVFNLFLISASVKLEMLIYCPPLPYTELIGGSAHKRYYCCDTQSLAPGALASGTTLLFFSAPY